MGWFQKKACPIPEDSPGGHKETPVSASETADSSRTSYLQHLQSIFTLDNAKGVVLKLYIENFKRLNDVFGYNYCEELLSQIIQYLKEKTQFPVYRSIGVEFIIILEGYTQGRASALADEILEQFDHVWKINDTDCLCSIQIGMCSYPGHAFSANEMMKLLDQAVSKASEYGPNQSVIYDTSLHTSYLRRKRIGLYLKTAIEKNEIDVRYRPTYDIVRQKFNRAEYYMRIFIQGLGMVSSNEFLPIAEDSGQIRAVEYFALNQVGSCIADLIAAGKDFESISLPISSILFLQEDFLDEIKRIIETYHIPRGKLALDIRESALTTAYLNINIMMQELSELGVELILNEFGSGYSGITTILELPVNTLKLERMFIWQLETNPKSEHIIDGLIHIARHLDLNIIAEGVETEHQAKILTESGCNLQQGFYYSPTISKEVLIEILDTSLEDSFHVLNHEKEKQSITS